MTAPKGTFVSLGAALDRVWRLPPSILVTWAMTFAFIAFLGGALAYSRMRIEQRLNSQIGTVTTLAADRMALTFDNVDGLLMSVVDDVRSGDFAVAPPRGEEQPARLRAMLSHHQMRSPDVVSLLLADDRGRVFAQSPGATPRDSIAATSHFRALASGPRRGPVLTSTAGHTGPTLHMARRVEAPDGTFLGVAAAHLDLTGSTAGFYRSLAIEEGDFIALRDMENALLAGHASVSRGSPGPVVGEDVVPGAIAVGSLWGVGYAQSPRDGIDRLIAYRKIPRYPLYLVHGKDVGELLATWRYEMLGVALAAVLALVVSGVLTAGIRRRMALTAQLETVRTHLKDSYAALRSALAATELMAAKDQLTGLWNRRTFDQRLHETVAHFERHRGTFSLLMLDMDNFKAINDRCGHVVGDDVLRRFADVLRERLRQNDVHARWGGEEFMVLADGASLENGITLAEQIRQAVETRAFPGVPSVTVSIGVAEYHAGDSEDELLRRADEALYEAKRAGRNRVVAAGSLAQGRLFLASGADQPPRVMASAGR